MKIQGLLQNPRFIAVVIFVGAFMLLLAIILFGVVGGSGFVFRFTSIVTPITSFITSLLFARAWTVEKNAVMRRTWAGMALGFGMWSIADMIWSVYDLVLQQQIPYPSLADLGWGLGYVFFYVSLITQLRKLPVAPTRQQNWIVYGVTVFWVVLTSWFVLRPIVSDFDPSRIAEGLLNVAFPLGDTGVVIITTFLLVLLRLSRFSLSWRLIFASLFIMTFSDLMFSYATWQGLYYPDQEVNFLTALVDFTYIASYLVAGLGIFIYNLVVEMKGAPVVSMETRQSPRFYAVLFTGRDRQIISASGNSRLLVDAMDQGVLVGKPLEQFLGIDRAPVQAFFEKLTNEGKVSNEQITIRTTSGQPRDVWLTAMADYDQSRRFTGANIAIRANMVVPEDQRLPSKKELLSDLNFILSTAGTRTKDETQSIRTFFVESIQALSTLLYQFGGNPFQKALYDELERRIKEQQLPIQWNGQSFVIPEELEGQDLAQVLLPLLRAAQTFVIGVVGKQIVEDEIHDLEQHLDAAVRKDVLAYGLGGMQG